MTTDVFPRISAWIIDHHLQVTLSMTKILHLPAGEKAKVQVFGKFHDIPRKQATYGDPGLMYSFSGVYHLARPWTPTLEYVRDAVTRATGYTFNFVLELDPNCPIASVSFGAARDFVFRHRESRGQRTHCRIDPVKLELTHGSLLLMNYPTNTYWYHSVPVRRRVLAPRINLTFRRIIMNMHMFPENSGVERSAAKTFGGTKKQSCSLYVKSEKATIVPVPLAGFFS
ncbi:hypothetical protein Z043_121897 [Scleropages formosus]|uniref:Fe2OG dioxygenase domain-containing protein n=1 Tax=Scleropages formosus TaxID=113540 RepID=A0A0P7TQN8_SCLFO|nr:hypothetical protein Z043_121897 [Scleropages formosus]